MNVFTYHEQINQYPPGTMELWRESWTRYGWTPAVLGVDDYHKHPACEFYDAATDKLPTFNNRIYERACYRRWLAMAPLGGGLMTDYDVVNRGFAPGNLRELCLTDLTILCENRVPCVVWGTGHQYAYAALQFAKHEVTEKDRYIENPGDPNHGKPLVEDMTILRHISDMHILGRTGEPLWFQTRPICCDVRDFRANPAGYANTTLIHCSAYGCHGFDRVQVMKDLMK